MNALRATPADLQEITSVLTDKHLRAIGLLTQEQSLGLAIIPKDVQEEKSPKKASEVPQLNRLNRCQAS